MQYSSINIRKGTQHTWKIFNFIHEQFLVEIVGRGHYKTNPKIVGGRRISSSSSSRFFYKSSFLCWGSGNFIQEFCPQLYYIQLREKLFYPIHHLSIAELPLVRYEALTLSCLMEFGDVLLHHLFPSNLSFCPSHLYIISKPFYLALLELVSVLDLSELKIGFFKCFDGELLMVVQSFHFLSQ